MYFSNVFTFEGITFGFILDIAVGKAAFVYLVILLLLVYNNLLITILSITAMDVSK